MLESEPRPTGAKHMVIMGCDSLGASVALSLAEKGHRVHLLDSRPEAFDRLPPDAVGDGQITPIVGEGSLQKDLIKASIRDADVFMALYDLDTTNALAGQFAKTIYDVPVVICRIDDPDRQEMYNELGLVAISATRYVTQMVVNEAIS